MAKAKGKAKKKDPNAPKRPQTGYFIFGNEQRKQMKEENPDAKVTEISKILGAKWKTMTEKEKEPFNQKAEIEKKRYKSEMEKYTPPSPPGSDSESDTKEKGGKRKRAVRKKKDPNAPKKPMSSFFLWLKENREQIKADLGAEAKSSEVAKSAGERWKSVSDAAKKKLQEKVEKAKEAYTKELAEYNKTKVGSDESEDDKPKKKQQTAKGKGKAADKKAPQTKGKAKKEEKEESDEGSEDEKKSGSGSESGSASASASESESESD